MKLVCISDTHLMHMRHEIVVPDGDVLIHAGDATFKGTKDQVQSFAYWFDALPHKHKIFVAGNHDFGFQTHRSEAVALLPKGCHYLEDSGVEIDGVKFWGSPWQPWFLDWAFNLPRGEALKAHWDLIPDGTDVLITHSPPFGILDLVPRGENVGCDEMLKAVRRVKPYYHIFGHIHYGYGRERRNGTTFINAAICDEAYEPINKPVVVEV
jgi:Icc-related predicted phosphoesterase